MEFLLFSKDFRGCTLFTHSSTQKAKQNKKNLQRIKNNHFLIQVNIAIMMFYHYLLIISMMGRED